MVCGFACAVPAAARVHDPIVAGHHRFVPALGDWDGTAAGGLHASFELTYAPFSAELGTTVSYEFQDLALTLPAICPAQPGGPTVDEVIGDHFATPVYAGGSFHLKGYGFSGGLTGARTATLTAHLTARSGKTVICRQATVWHLRPAHRTPVLDGRWKVRFGDGETGSFTVDAGGRLASSLGLPRGFACGFGGVNLFIPPSGAVTFSSPYATVALNFRKRTAAGWLSGQVPGGQSCRLQMTASLQKRAR